MPLTIEQIERDRKNFFAPAFNVVVAKQSLLQDLRLEVASVQVDQMNNAAHRFSFVVHNGFDITRREFIKVAGKTLPDFFAFGTDVEIHMGYGDRRSLDLMLSGIVTEWSTSFPSSGLPQLTISGYDHFYRMTRGTRSKNWEAKKDSDVVREIARDYNLDARVEETDAVQPKIEQSQESSAQFVRRLAERNSFEFFVTGKQLFFRTPDNTTRGTVELAWGRGLVSFAPEINLSEQVTAVEVYGWDIRNKKAIVGRARKGDEEGRDRARASGAPRASGGEYLQKIAKQDEGVLRVRMPVFSEQDATERARAILNRRSAGFVGGRAESIGIPDIKPNTNVTLQGLGDLFSSTFYVKQATHTVDASGYRTAFQIEDKTI
jgi:Bacteriophage probable baseplate hub protein